jgi:D-3-phosphoglycerate dehydrogenase
MSDPVDALVLDLLDSISSGRSYREVIEAWKTSCPRLPVWEEANARGYLEQHSEPGQPSMIRLSPRGREVLEKARRASGAA